jgi:hypothetical protein
LTSALVEGEWSASRPGRFTPGERARGAHWMGGWVNPRADLDDVGKIQFLTLPGLEHRPLGRPALRQSLHQLRYPGYWNNGISKSILSHTFFFRLQIMVLNLSILSP